MNTVSQNTQTHFSLTVVQRKLSGCSLLGIGRLHLGGCPPGHQVCPELSTSAASSGNPRTTLTSERLATDPGVPTWSVILWNT